MVTVNMMYLNLWHTAELDLLQDGSSERSCGPIRSRTGSVPPSGIGSPTTPPLVEDSHYEVEHCGAEPCERLVLPHNFSPESETSLTEDATAHEASEADRVPPPGRLHRKCSTTTDLCSSCAEAAEHRRILRRRAQNRQAQRKFRARKEIALQDKAGKLAQLEGELANIRKACQSLSAINSDLQMQLARLNQRLVEKEQCWDTLQRTSPHANTTQHPIQQQSPVGSRLGLSEMGKGCHVTEGLPAEWFSEGFSD